MQQVIALLNEDSLTEASGAQPDLRIAAEGGTEGTLAVERILVPVDRMSSLLNGITLAELRDAWTDKAPSPNFTTIYPSSDVMPDLERLLGQPGLAVKPVPPAAVESAVWEDRMGLGIVPFEALHVKLRAIRLDGMSATDNRLDQAKWPLATRAWLVPLTDPARALLERLDGRLPLVNRDPERLTVLVMTGVTAMARNSAVAIEKANDYGFLARQVGPELAAADLTIISNEIPFVENCRPDNTLNNLILCSKPEYFLNLELSGVDAVGLTGNHQNDFGYDACRSSLAFYESKAIPVYGGGTDNRTAEAPLVLEHHGNRLGFLGANQWGPERYRAGTGEEVSAWAAEGTPGSARFSLEQMTGAIKSLRPKVDLVLAEVQHTEFNELGEYTTDPIPQQEADFRAMSDAGADVVTGVQAHAPQVLEMRSKRLILYGLGNLYFDQTWSWPTRTGLVARHAIYEGRLVNTELLVTVIDMNFQLRWATAAERAQVLRTVLDTSRW